MSEKLRDDQPIFQQIAEKIETTILDESLKVGDQVPSTNVFAKHYQINPATAAKGINLLVSQGVIVKKRGIGMFVTPEAREIILSKRKDEFYNDYILPLIQEAKRIDISEDQLMNWIRKGS